MQTNSIRVVELKGMRGFVVKLGAILTTIAITLTLVACGSGASSFSIEGKWKNTGTGTYGQMQSGAIVTFDGKNCNVFSSGDTYAFYKEDGAYRLDVTGLLGGSPSFAVTIIDNDHISMTTGSSTTVELTRVG